MWLCGRKPETSLCRLYNQNQIQRPTKKRPQIKPTTIVNEVKKEDTICHVEQFSRRPRLSKMAMKLMSMSDEDMVTKKLTKIVSRVLTRYKTCMENHLRSLVVRKFLGSGHQNL